MTLADEFPRIQVMRGAKRKGTRYFGPYAHAWAIRETVDLLLRVFPVRTCSAGVFKRAHQQGRPVPARVHRQVLGAVRRPRSRPDDHQQLAQDFCDFMAGDTAKFTRRLTARMKEAAAELELRARGAAARRHRDAASGPPRRTPSCSRDGTDADIFALAGDELEAAVQVFHVRDGRIRGQRGWVVEKVEDITDAELVEHLLQQIYGSEAAAGDGGAGSSAVPREVLVPVLPPDVEQVQAWLRGLRGSRVSVRVPQRGDKRELAATVHRNAEHALVLHRTRRAGDLTTRSQALQEIQEALDLPSAPLRIECYDVSHNQGTYQSASMVVFEDGLARKSEYRLFTIRGPEGQGARDDTAAMHEVITRRFRRYLADRADARDVELGGGEDEDGVPLRSGPIDEVTGKPARFAYPPNLSWSTAGRRRSPPRPRAMAELGIDDVALVGLAKRLEEVWLPGEEYPVILQRSSRGPVPAAAPARRGAPVRHHRAPQAPEQGHDHVGARRRPGLGPGASGGAAAALRVASSGCGPRRSRRSPRCRAWGTGPRRRSSRRSPRREWRRTRCPSRLACWTHERRAFADHGARRDPRPRGGHRGAPPQPAAGPDHHRDVRRGPHAGGRRAGGPRLVRHRQPARPDAHAPGRHADQRARRRRARSGSPP